YQAKGPISYPRPQGSKESGPRPGFGGLRVITSFQVSEGGESGKVDVMAEQGTSLSRGLLENINRWRGQVGLDSITPAALAANPPRSIKIDGQTTHLVDLAGEKQRQIVAWTTDGGKVWYFKLIGTPAVVEAHKARFESFLSGIKFVDQFMRKALQAES